MKLLVPTLVVARPFRLSHLPNHAASTVQKWSGEAPVTPRCVLWGGRRRLGFDSSVLINWDGDKKNAGPGTTLGAFKSEENTSDKQHTFLEKTVIINSHLHLIDV